MYITKIKKHIATKKNLNANAENGSLLSTIGRVVINAEDQSKTNTKGRIFVTLFLLHSNLLKVNLLN